MVFDGLYETILAGLKTGNVINVLDLPPDISAHADMRQDLLALVVIDCKCKCDWFKGFVIRLDVGETIKHYAPLIDKVNWSHYRAEHEPDMCLGDDAVYEPFSKPPIYLNCLCCTPWKCETHNNERFDYERVRRQI